MPDLTYELRRVEAPPDEGFVEVHDEIGASVIHGADDHAGRLLLLAEAIRELAQLSALHSSRLDEDDVALPLDDREVCSRRCLRLARLLAHRLELTSELVGLEARAMEVRVRLTRRDGLDPPRAGADGALRQPHERAPPGRPTPRP